MRYFEFQLKRPRYYQLSTTCHSHGWRYLAPFHWDETEQALDFSLFVEDKPADDTPVDIHVQQRGRHLELSARSATRLTTTQQEFVINAVSRVLGVNTDTTALHAIAQSIDPRYGALVKNGAGRLLRAPTLWEDIAKTLFTTNCSWNLTCIMSNAACSSRFSAATPGGAYPFPNVGVISRKRETTLRQHMRVGYRAAYIRDIALQLLRNIAEPKLEILDADALRDRFSALSGFGPYAVNHMLLLCGVFDRIPVDSVVRSYLQKYHDTTEYAAFIEHHYARWAPYQWWGMVLERRFMCG